MERIDLIVASIKLGQVPLVTNRSVKDAIIAVASAQGVEIVVGHSPLGFHLMAKYPESIHPGRTEVISE